MSGKRSCFHEAMATMPPGVKESERIRVVRIGELEAVSRHTGPGRAAVVRGGEKAAVQ